MTDQYDEEPLAPKETPPVSMPERTAALRAAGASPARTARAPPRIARRAPPARARYLHPRDMCAERRRVPRAPLAAAQDQDRDDARQDLRQDLLGDEGVAPHILY